MAPNFTLFTNPSEADSQSLVNLPELLNVNDTSVCIRYVFDGTSVSSGYPDKFLIELAMGEINQDFLVIGQSRTDDAVSIPGTGSFYDSYTVNNLSPTAIYRIRIVPVFRGGTGFPSSSLTFATLATPTNYWEPIVARRNTEAIYRRGFTDPVLTRPHLTEGVEVFGERTHGSLANDTDILRSTSLWYSDAPHSEAHELPSGRRGNSLTLVQGTVYMFGGRTNGTTASKYMPHIVITYCIS